MNPDTPHRRKWLLPLIMGFIMLFLLSSLLSNPAPSANYSRLQADVAAGRVEAAVLNVNKSTAQIETKTGSKYQTGYIPQAADGLLKDLKAKNVQVTINSGSTPWLMSALLWLIPAFILFGLFLWIMSRGQGGPRQIMQFTKTRARQEAEQKVKITFRDVAGANEAVEELEEIKDFLTDPEQFLKLGARIPKGVLLYGPPGTGKTLLARAVAGEADVPFFSLSGSDFVEMFVGVGASRVRDLFAQAKQSSPSIIFVDEIDAVGRHRGAGLGGGNDEREQTLNALLVEMDGFDQGENVIVIAATNRPDVLDPALLRPGRFDRQIAVDRPDRGGRIDILKVHTRGKPLSSQINIDALAGQTPGFTGADLANLINEAALLAARRKSKLIEQEDLEESIMRILAGPQKRSRILSKEERRITAYHEMGHALVGHALKHADDIHKISIMSRGQALGVTISLPDADQFLVPRQRLLDQMAMSLGGRAAEALVFDEITTGASSDLERVTQIAKQMVTRYGMSDKLGPRVFGHEHSQPFLGREFSSEPDYSDEIAQIIDEEVGRLVNEAYQRAYDLLSGQREDLDRLSDLLLIEETIERERFIDLLKA